jgi:membrane peptidoglycan carboxypeptidase
MIVGPESFGFTPYAQITDYLKNALLTTEDPLFFSHRGFYEEAFRQSIATNFVAGRFKRGGSTISMQLVKNLFLTRNKTIARKLEEVLIVWMIENGRLIDKQRMFEVYLNIIEWGPNVYGVTDAARFYFDKFPSELNLGESIFLASIVPKPKRFKNSFLPDAELKPYMHKYFKLIGGLMVRRGKVPATDTIGIFNSVKVKSLAKSMILAVDTIAPIVEEDNQ